MMKKNLVWFDESSNHTKLLFMHIVQKNNQSKDKF